VSDHPSLIPGAEPLSHVGDRRGALVLHGFTGNPNTVRPVANALVAAGFSVEMPRLPGHGTTLADMMTTGWSDWTGEVALAYERLAARTDSIVAVGLSMGGSLALWAACTRRLDAVVCINPKIRPESEEIREMARGMLSEGETYIPGSGSDIADPDAHESGYDDTPIGPALSFFEGLDDLGAQLRSLTSPAPPLLIMTSSQDHVVPPEESDLLANLWPGTVDRVALERSFHVATLDFDRQLICDRTVTFAQTMCAAGAGQSVLRQRAD
jgi:carboxylesterase